MICEIKAFGRIHAGLVDLSESGYRLNGGVGWALDGDHLLVRAEPGDGIEIVDRRDAPLSIEELASLKSLLGRFAADRETGGVRLVIEGDLPSHRGLGAGTAMRLAMIEAAAAVAKVETSPAEIVRASGRGGTSGVGVRTYFEGGLVVDLGHRRDAPAAPSRDRTATGTALPLLRADMPLWRFGLATTSALAPVDIAIERKVFAQTLPLPIGDVQRALYDIVFGMVAGILDDDASAFVTAVEALQQGAWKRAEWSIHGAVLGGFADRIRAAGGLGVGLSSMGPTLYFLRGPEWLEESQPVEVRWTIPRNRGRELRLLDRA